MERQSIGKALFGGQGGLFVMTTQGQGPFWPMLLVRLKKLNYKTKKQRLIMPMWCLEPVWTDDIHLENGFWRLIGTGWREWWIPSEVKRWGLCAKSLNLQSFAGSLNKYIQKVHNNKKTRQKPKPDADVSRPSFYMKGQLTRQRKDGMIGDNTRFQIIWQTRKWVVMSYLKIFKSQIAYVELHGDVCDDC